MSKWRIGSGALVLVSNNKFYDGKNHRLILITNVDNKKEQDGVRKYAIESGIKGYKEIWIDEADKFKLRVASPGLTLFAKHPSLPEPDEWYEVRNFMSGGDSTYFLPEFSKLIENTTIVNGNLEGTYEPIFSPDLPTAVSFTSKNFPEYQEFYEEMERRLNLELYKKTTKWTKGNRYDNETMSMYCLGTVTGRFTNRGKTAEQFDFSETQKFTTPNIVIALNHEPEVKTADGIWDNVIISSPSHKNYQNLYFLVKKYSAVCVGEFMDPKEDILTGVDFRSKIFYNTLEKSCTVKEKVCEGIPEVVTYRNLFQLIEQFFYIFPGEEDKSIKDIVAPVLGDLMRVTRESILDCLKLSRAIQSMISDGTFPDDRIAKELMNLFINSRINGDSLTVYYKFYEAIGVNLLEEAKKILIDFKNNSSSSLYSGIENYVASKKYIEMTGGIKYLDLRTDKSSYNRSPKKLTEEISGEFLRQELEEIIKHAMNNYGEGVQSMQYTKDNSRSEGSYLMEISVKDIWLKYYEKGMKLSNNLINDIISTKLYTINVNLDESWSLSNES